MSFNEVRPVPTDIRETLERTISREAIMEKIVAEVKRRSVKTVYFVGVGGSWASSIPASLQLQRSTRALSTYNVNATEFTAMYLDQVGSDTLVIATSHSGGTPETSAAARMAAAKGALVVGVATDAENSLSETSAFMLTYESDRTITAAKYALLTQLAALLINACEPSFNYPAFKANLERMPAVTEKIVLQMEPVVRKIAETYSERPHINVLATGPFLGLGYMLSVCYLLEMQWKHSNYFNSADFFHGPFELATNNEPYVVLAGVGATRPLSTRLFDFFDQYHDRYQVLDSSTFEMESIDEEYREQLEIIPMAVVTSRLAEHFEPITGHDLDTRRYMHKVSY